MLYTSPVPTPAPVFNPRLLQREPNSFKTCAFVSGSSARPLRCGGGLSYTCYTDHAVRAIDCCSEQETTKCQAATACVPSDSPIPSDNRRTLYCSSTDLPSCVTFLVATDDDLSGWSFLNCDSTAALKTIYLDSTDGSTSTTPTTSTISTTPPLPPSPTPVGAIVGGVVGGIAALALIGLIGFFLLRKKKNKATGSSPHQPVVSQYQPPLIDQTSQGYNPDYDYMRPSSVAKSTVPYATGTTSPEPQHQPGFGGTGASMSPEPGYPSGYTMGQQSLSTCRDRSASYEMPTSK